MANSKNGDMMTVLRHLVEQTNWQGNHGARAETQDAMDRLMGGQYGDDAAQADNDPNAKGEPDVSGGSRNPAQSAKRNTGTGAK